MPYQVKQIRHVKLKGQTGVGTRLAKYRVKRNRTGGGWMRKFVLLLSGLLIAQGFLWGGVRRVRVPGYGVSPDVVMAPSGEVYVVFARDQNAFLAISKDNGHTFFDPLQLNRAPRSVLGGHERGPKIALGGGSTAHIVWMSAKSDQLLYTRGAPDTGEFTPPRNLLDAKTHLDGVTAAADKQGDVLWPGSTHARAKIVSIPYPCRFSGRSRRTRDRRFQKTKLRRPFVPVPVVR